MKDHPASFRSPLRKAVIHVAHELKHATVSREDMANELLDALPDDPAPDLYAALELCLRVVELRAGQDAVQAEEAAIKALAKAKPPRS